MGIKSNQLLDNIFIVTFIVAVFFYSKGLFCVKADQEFMASTPNLKLLAKHEQKLLSILNKYTEQLEFHINKLKRYVENFQQHFSGNEISDLTSCKNWLTFDNAFSLNSDESENRISTNSWTVYKSLVDMQSLTKNAEYKSLQDKIRILLNETFLPKFSDFVESILSLLSLISIYELDASDLSKGKLVNTVTKSGLSPSILFEIGLYAQESKMYDVSVDYLHEAFVQFSSYLNITMRSDSKELSGLREKLLTAISLHDENFEAGGNFYSERLVSMEHSSFINRKRPHVEILPVVQQEQGDVYSLQMFRNFEILCRSGDSEPIFEKRSDLKCLLYSKIHPYWLLSPLKVEILHKSPLVFQVYNVLTDSQMNVLIREAEPNLQRSRVFNNKDNSTEGKAKDEKNSTTIHRTSSNSWLDDRVENSEHGYVNILAQLITGLTTRRPTSTELLQLANYATGGHFIPHVDAFFYDEMLQHLSPQDISMGDRYGTFMVYLNDVEQGGGTAFPLLGVVAKPIKGSALFWLNLHPDGSINSKTLHGGCSVLTGTKYIANKWIRRHDQMFIMKCPKDYETNSELQKHYFYRNFYQFQD